MKVMLNRTRFDSQGISRAEGRRRERLHGFVTSTHVVPVPASPPSRRPRLTGSTHNCKTAIIILNAELFYLKIRTFEQMIIMILGKEIISY